MSLRLTDLRNFLEVATASTMREASDRLGITQPALSESIKRLESDLGEVLFYRSRSGVRLTPGGQEAFRKAGDVIAALEALGQGNDQARSQRILTIGCHPVVASYCLPAALKFLARSNPKFRVRLKHDLSRNVLAEIQQGRIDVGIVVNPVPSPDLVIKTLAEDEVAVWRLDGDSKVTAAAKENLFCDLSLIQTQSILRKWKAKPANVIATDSLELIVRFVSEGLGCGILPARAVALLEATNCQRVPQTPVYHDKISVVYRPEFGKHPDERSLIESLKRSLA